MEFRLLGPVGIWEGGRQLGPTTAQQRSVLAMLLLDAGVVVPVDNLVRALWGEDPPRSAANAVQGHVSKLRRMLEQVPEAELTTSGRGYRLTVDRQRVDLHRFRGLVEATSEDDPDEAAALLGTALALWRGPALADVSGDWLSTLMAAELAQERLAAVEQLAAIELRFGYRPDSVAELSVLVANHPLRERLVYLLMKALHRSGRRTDALALFRDTRQRLVDELGVEPGHELQSAHREILDADSHPPVSAVSAALVVPRHLPPYVAPFVGRAEGLNALDGMVAPAGDLTRTAAAIVTISGTAGVGKSALALHWSHRSQQSFPDGQLYVDMRGFDADGSSMSPAEAMQGFLHALHVPAHRIPESLAAQSNLYRSLLADRRMLVVLDNARDAEQVRPLLPGAPGCLALITSRDRLSGLVVAEGARPIHVELMSDGESRELLASRLGTDRVAAEPDAVDRIVAGCVGLPLALAIVAARATMNPGFTLSAIAGELAAVRGRLDGFDGVERADVRAVFSWSYRTLTPDAARLFRLLGLLPGPDLAIPAAASLAGLPPSRVRTSLAELAAAQLLTERTPGRYTFHDLLRAYATELVHDDEGEANRRAAQHRLFDHYLHTADQANRSLYPNHAAELSAPLAGVTVADVTDQQRAIAWFDAEHQSLLAAIDQAAGHGFDTHTWQLARSTMQFFQRCGLWYGMVSTRRAVLEAADRTTDPAGLAHLHRSVAIALSALRRDDEAHKHLWYALDRFREIGDAVYEADTHHGIAWVYDRLGKPRESLHHAEQALALSRATGRRTAVANALNNIGWLSAQLDRYDDARSYCEQALAMHREDNDTHGMAATLDSLGFIHHRLGQHQEAITYYGRALGLYREVASRYYESRTLTRLGESYDTIGDSDAARRTWRQALDILDEFRHPDADQLRHRLDGLGKPPAATLLNALSDSGATCR